MWCVLFYSLLLFSHLKQNCLVNELFGCSFYLFQAHPWFEDVQWDRLYHMEAAFIPEVNDELDTQNFEKFEEVDVCIL